MEKDLQISEDLIIPGCELWITASLSGGPGGQHVNKVSSRVTLHWNPTTSTALTDSQRQRIVEKLAHRISTDGMLPVSCDTHRSQHRNRIDVRLKMAALVLAALKTQRKRIPTRVSPAKRQRRVNAKRQRGAVKQLRRNAYHNHE